MPLNKKQITNIKSSLAKKTKDQEEDENLTNISYLFNQPNSLLRWDPSTEKQSFKNLFSELKSKDKYLIERYRSLLCKYHGTIIQTGITSKKILYYMRHSACRCFIVKEAKIFWSYDKDFWILAGVGTCRILIGLCK